MFVRRVGKVIIVIAPLLIKFSTYLEDAGDLFLTKISIFIPPKFGEGVLAFINLFIELHRDSVKASTLSLSELGCL